MKISFLSPLYSITDTAQSSIHKQSKFHIPSQHRSATFLRNLTISSPYQNPYEFSLFRSTTSPTPTPQCNTPPAVSKMQTINPSTSPIVVAPFDIRKPDDPMTFNLRTHIMGKSDDLPMRSSYVSRYSFLSVQGIKSQVRSLFSNVRNLRISLHLQLRVYQRSLYQTCEIIMIWEDCLGIPDWMILEGWHFGLKKIDIHHLRYLNPPLRNYHNPSRIW